MNPAQQLIELYNVLLSPGQFSQELIEQASNHLIQLYNTPETLFILLDLYTQNPGNNIKLFITTGMKFILSDKEKWFHYREANQSSDIKSAFLQIIQNEQDPHLFQNVIAAVQPILVTDYMIWPEYIQLIDEFSSTGKFLFSVTMANSMIENITETSFLPNVWDPFCNLALQGLTSNDFAIINESARLVAAMFQFAETISTNLLELFTTLFQVFEAQMNINSQICGQIIDYFEHISDVENFYFPNILEIFQRFSSIILNPSYDINLRCLLVYPLILFVFNDQESDKSGIIGTIYDIIFIISSSSYIENECEEYQENMLYCQFCLQIILKLYDAGKIRELIISKGAGSNSKGEIVTYLLLLNELAECNPDIIIHDTSSFLNFIFACIEANDHTIQEASYDLLSTLFKRPSDAYFGIQDRFFSITFQVLSINHLPLLSKVFTCIYQYLETVTIRKDVANKLLDIFFQSLKTYNHIGIQFIIIDCFANLIKSLADDVGPYIDTILPVVIHGATQMNKPEECDLKASAVECLGIIIQYFNSIPDISQILQVFVECIQSDENMLISAGFRALENVVIAQRPEIIQVLPICLETSLKIISSELSFVDDEDLEELNDVILDVWTFTMNFISQVAKKIPDSIRPALGNFLNALYKDIDDGVNDEIECLSISTASVLIKLCPPDEAAQFLLRVVQILIDTDSFKTASLCFHIIGKFIRKQPIYQIPVSEEVISATCDLGLNAMRRQLTFQEELKELEFDVDFGTHLYYFFEDVACTAPQLFPLNDFWKISTIIFERGVPFEQSEIISVLRVLYSSTYGTMPNIQKKLIIREFVKKLQICDCFIPPYPIAAVRTVADLEANQLERYLPDVMNFVDQALEIVFDDQLAFNSTMDYVNSLLFSLFRIIFKENFDVGKYMNQMLSLLPSTTNSDEAANTYMNLVFLCGEYPKIMGSFSIEIIRALSQTFALKEKEWELIGLPIDIIQSMAILLNNLLSLLKQGNEVLAVSVPDEMAMQRFQQRFTTFLPAPAQ